MDNVAKAGPNSMQVSPAYDHSSSDDWSYVAGSGGIVDTTAVTLCPVGEPNKRPLITRLDVLNTHATVDTEVTILDGATVIWRRKMKSANVAGSSFSAAFSPPLRGSPGAAITAVCGTTGSQIYINAGGRQI